jgi:hypothetical protein
MSVRAAASFEHISVFIWATRFLRGFMARNLPRRALNRLSEGARVSWPTMVQHGDCAGLFASHARRQFYISRSIVSSAFPTLYWF